MSPIIDWINFVPSRKTSRNAGNMFSAGLKGVKVVRRRAIGDLLWRDRAINRFYVIAILIRHEDRSIRVFSKRNAVG